MPSNPTELAGGPPLPPAIGGAVDDQAATGRFPSGAVRRILFAMARTVAVSHFVGRAAELGRLHAAFDAARNSDPVMLCVGGEAGVGKTRLVTQFAEQVRATG